MKKIALIQPFEYKEMDSRSYDGSIGLAYISAHLKQSGYETKVFDANHEKDISDKVIAYAPDGIGMTITSSKTQEAGDLADKIKSRLPVPILVGGPYFTLMPEHCFETIDADIGIRGDGIPAATETFDLFFARKDISSVDGIAYRNGSGIIKNGKRAYDLSQWPPADRSGLNKRKIEGISIHELVSSVGCKGSCKFCIVPQIRDPVSVRPTEEVMKEMEFLDNLEQSPFKHGSNIYYFYDEDFLGIEGHFTDIVQGMDANEIDGMIVFDARADNILNSAKELYSYRRKIAHINFGEESLVKAQLDRWKKGITPEQNIEATDFVLRGLGRFPLKYRIVADLETDMDELRQVSESFYHPIPINLLLIHDTNLYFDPIKPYEYLDQYPLHMHFYSELLQFTLHILETDYIEMRQKATLAYVDDPNSRKINKIRKATKKYMDALTYYTEKLSRGRISSEKATKKHEKAMIKFIWDLHYAVD